MDVPATMTSKGQVTVPKSVRDALGLQEGDQVLFRVYKNRAVLAKVPNFLTLAGSVPVPPSKRGASWPQIRAAARQGRSGRG